MTQLVQDHPLSHDARLADGAGDDALADFRRSIGRFAHTYASLPTATRATCPTCRQVVPARFERRGEQVVLRYDCARCGELLEVHHDHIWTPSLSDSARAAITVIKVNVPPVMVNPVITTPSARQSLISKPKCWSVREA